MIKWWLDTSAWCLFQKCTQIRSRSLILSYLVASATYQSRTPSQPICPLCSQPRQRTTDRSRQCDCRMPRTAILWFPIGIGCGFLCQGATSYIGLPNRLVYRRKPNLNPVKDLWTGCSAQLCTICELWWYLKLPTSFLAFYDAFLIIIIFLLPVTI